MGGTQGSYTSDANGNTLTGGGRTSTWDSQNRMATCAYQGNTCSYVYGCDGIRHQSTVNGTTTNYVLDNSMFVREQRVVNGAATNYATYLTGPRGPEYRRDDTTGAIRWYVYDGLGSVAAEVDPSGNVTAKRKYDVYGLVRSGDAGTSNHKFVGALGHPSEAETGLVYMQARCMDPSLGRFTSEDPGRNGSNWFAYASDDPVCRVDATGKSDNFALGLLWTNATLILRASGLCLTPIFYAIAVTAAVVTASRAVANFSQALGAYSSQLSQVNKDFLNIFGSAMGAGIGATAAFGIQRYLAAMGRAASLLEVYCGAMGGVVIGAILGESFALAAAVALVNLQ